MVRRACLVIAAQDPGALQLLHTFFAASHDIFYISFGRWHSNNCDGIDAAYTESLETVGAYLQVRCTVQNVTIVKPEALNLSGGCRGLPAIELYLIYP